MYLNEKKLEIRDIKKCEQKYFVARAKNRSSAYEWRRNQDEKCHIKRYHNISCKVVYFRWINRSLSENLTETVRSISKEIYEYAWGHFKRDYITCIDCNCMDAGFIKG